MRRDIPTGSAPLSKEANKILGQTAVPGKPAFTGGDQGFLSLKLEKSEIINHNTKKLTFSLPEADMESGLHVACTLEVSSWIPYHANMRSRRHHQVQGPRDGEARHPAIHAYERCW